MEKTAPSRHERDDTPAAGPTVAPRRRVAPDAPATSAPRREPEEVLIVASRLKDFVKRRSGYNTSDRVLAPLSAVVRRAVEHAIESARRDGRMTVLDRDIPQD